MRLINFAFKQLYCLDWRLARNVGDFFFMLQQAPWQRLSVSAVLGNAFFLLVFVRGGRRRQRQKKSVKRGSARVPRDCDEKENRKRSARA